MNELINPYLQGSSSPETTPTQPPLTDSDYCASNKLLFFKPFLNFSYRINSAIAVQATVASVYVGHKWTQTTNSNVQTC